MQDCTAVFSAILMTDAFGCLTTNGIDDVGRAFNGTVAIPQAVPERVYDASICHRWLKPFVERRTDRVRIAFGFAAVFGEGEGRACIFDLLRCP